MCVYPTKKRWIEETVRAIAAAEVELSMCSSISLPYSYYPFLPSLLPMHPFPTALSLPSMQYHSPHNTTLSCV